MATGVRHDYRIAARREVDLSWLAPIGRFLFVSIFLVTTPMHFSASAIEHARSQGVPLANLLVPMAGILSLVGGLSVLFGFHARFGALALVLFLVPVTLMMHAFWNVGDPQAAMMQRIMFMKNVSMLGGALLIAYLGPGPVSFDTRRERQSGRWR